MTLERLEGKVDELITGQGRIQRTLGTVLERSGDNKHRIGRLEKGGMGFLVTITLALLLSLLPGCGLFKGLFPPPQPAAPEAPKVDILGRALDNTLALTVEEGIFCSGVAAEGVFLTAAHCVDDGIPFGVLYRGKNYPGTVAAMWPETDLALIDAVGAPVRDTVPLTEWEPQVGQKVVWTGYAMSVELALGKGIIAALDSTSSWAPGAVVVYGQFMPGNSGGPVFDETGKLIGVVRGTVSSDVQAFPLGYVTSPAALKEALKSL